MLERTNQELYKLPESWIWVKTGDVCDGLVPGRTKPKSFDGDIPWITLPDIEGLYVSQSKKDIAVAREEAEAVGMKVMPKNTVLISCVGQFGLICIAANPVVPNQQLHGFVCLNQVLPEYVAYALKTQVHQMEQMASATTISYLNKTKCNSINFPLAPLNEPRRIVSTIEQLTDRSHRAIAALEDVPKPIEQFRQSVLAAAFRGDLTADWREKNPDVEPASELLERIKIDRRKRWEEAELDKMKEKSKEVLNNKWKDKYKEPEEIDISTFPDLPNGWNLAKWEQIGICQNGRAFPSNEYSLEGTKLLRPGNLHISGNVQWTESNTRYMPNDWAEKYPSHVVEGNNLVVNLTAQSLADEFLGRVCLTSKGDRCLLNQRIARLTPAIISPKFCLWLLKSPIFRRYVDKLNTGSMIQHMFTSQIDDFIFPLPPLEEQSEIVKLIEFQFKKIEQIVLLSDEISADLPGLDRSILAKAFRGELVPQDPNDEPAAALLERIRAEREQTSSNKQRGKTTRKNSSKQLSIAYGRPGASTFGRSSQIANKPFR